MCYIFDNKFLNEGKIRTRIIYLSIDPSTWLFISSIYKNLPFYRLPKNFNNNTNSHKDVDTENINFIIQIFTII